MWRQLLILCTAIIDPNVLLFTFHFFAAYADPIIYNLKVVGHVAKQVYIAESLAPPKSLSTIVDAYKTFYSRAINKDYYQRLLKTGEWKKVAIYGLEAYGIFTIGEMVRLYSEQAQKDIPAPAASTDADHTLYASHAQIGRRSLIGYDLEKHGDGGHH